MKSKILLLSLLVVILHANAQEIASKTIGLRFGDDDGLGAEITYQHALASNTRLEAGLAWRSNKNVSAFKIAATHQWVWELDLFDNLNWYAGAGGGIGSWKTKTDNGSFFFLAGDIGTEYKFNFPLLLSLDFRPEFGLSNYNNGLDFDIALAVRYTFN